MAKFLKEVRGFRSFNAVRAKSCEVSGEDSITIRGPATLVFCWGFGCIKMKKGTVNITPGTIVNVGYEMATISATPYKILDGLILDKLKFLLLRHR